MASSSAAWILGGCFCLAATAHLQAQTLPLPELPPPDLVPADPTAPPGKGAPVQAPTDMPARKRPQPWDYIFGAGVGWDSNIDFLVPGGPSGMTIVPRGEVTRIFWSPRGELHAIAGGRWSGYPENSDLNRYYGEGRLGGDYRSSLRTSWHFDSSYSFGYTDASPILIQQGVPLPVVKTRSLITTLNLKQKVGRSSTLRVEGRFYSTDFQASNLTDGRSLRGGVALEQQFNPRHTLGFAYALERVVADVEDRSYLTHFGSLQWTRVISPRSAILLEAGASFTPNAANVGVERQENFYGGLSYTRRISNANLTAFVRREITPAFGLGVAVQETRTGLNTDLPLGRNWRLRLAGFYMRPDRLTYPAYGDGLTSLGRRFGDHLEVSAEARYRYRGETTAFRKIDAFQGALFFTFVPPGKRRAGGWGLY